MNLPIESNPFPLGCQRDSTDHGEPIMAVPLPLNRGSSPGCPGAADHRLQHKPALVQEDNATILPSGVFLYPATAASSTAQWQLHLSLALAFPVSGNSSYNPGGFSKHERDGTGFRILPRLLGLPGVESINHPDIHGLLPPSTIISTTSLFAPDSYAVDALYWVWPPRHLFHLLRPYPSTALPKKAKLSLVGLLPEHPVLVSKEARLFFSELPMPLFQYLVSCNTL